MEPTTAAEQADALPWWASLPEPKASCRRLEPADVIQLLESQAGLDARRHRSFLLVDVRRTDWQGGALASSINLPAHSFYQTRAIVYQFCKQAGIKTLIFYCSEHHSRPSRRTPFGSPPGRPSRSPRLASADPDAGTSSGRGPRCAGWMQDYLDHVGDQGMVAAVLKGGISAWQEAYGGRMLDWYDGKYWAKSGS